MHKKLFLKNHFSVIVYVEFREKQLTKEYNNYLTNLKF